MESGTGRSKMPASPITGSDNVEFQDRISSRILIDGYKSKLNIDVQRFFPRTDYVEVWKCLDTNLVFFYPFFTAGDGTFYEELQQFPWYYMKDKWEYTQALEYINPGMKVLEIGCGDGNFMIKALSKGSNVVGLELNEKGVKAAKSRELEVYRESIQDYARNHSQSFDLVCSFQVMEHVVDPGEIVKASIEVLRKNGILIVSVPNNKAFPGWSMVNLLNSPPHHLLRWDQTSLTNLTKFFPIRLEKLVFEHLQPEHYQTFLIEFLRKLYLPEVMVRIFNSVSSKLKIYMIMSLLAKRIKGHTVMAIYRKK